MSTKAQMHARACHTSMKTSCYSGTFKIWGFWRHPDAVVHYDHAGQIPSGAAAGEKSRREKVYVKAIGIWHERTQRTGWAGTAAASLLQPRFKSYCIGSSPAGERSDQWRPGGVR